MKDDEIDFADTKPRQLMLDDTAVSAGSELPAFLAKPEGSPAYHGFPLVLETMTDGWCLGAITEYLDPDGCDSGDAYVVAPDGTRAGLVWDVGAGDVTEICPPDELRWGLYQIWFPRPIRTTDDLVACFREVLPQLQEIYDQLRH
ncbi:MAG: 3-deoxy-8-phosphooctulonate synthase [Pyrinomonadaceae bacterium]